MSVHSRTSVRRLLWESVLRIGTSTMRELRLLRAAQWMTKEENGRDQEHRLRNLIVRATTAPHWREVLREAGVAGSRAEPDLTRFQQVPILEKSTLRGNTQQLIAAPGLRGAYWNASGGSTGEPVRILQHAAYRDRVRAAAMLFSEWASYAPGEVMVKLWGSERDLFDGGAGGRTRLIRWLRAETWLNTFSMHPGDLRAYCLEINRQCPAHILGYVESVYDIARYAMNSGLALHSPRTVMVSAGPLEPPVRDLISRVFGAPVFDRYGSREVGDVACDCSAHRGLHVVSPYHLVEIVRPDGSATLPGEVGDVLVTCLTNHAMPLIRYRIGDRAAWAEGPCPCGRPWPLLARVVGRASDVFVRADGGRVHGEYFTHLFYFADWASKFQVVQETPNRIVVSLVASVDAEAVAGRLAELTSKIRLVMGEQCDVDYRFVDHIPPLPSGKFQYTISRIAGSSPGS